MNEAPRLRVHYVWKPRQHRRYPWYTRRWLAFAVTFVLASVGGTGLLTFLLLLIQSQAGWGPLVPVWVIPAGLLVLYHRARQRAYWRHRARRLDAILRHPEGPRRLPHRVWEREEYRLFPSPRRQRRRLRDHPGSCVIVINGDRLDSMPRPRPVAVPFEPISLATEDERAGWLVLKTLQEMDALDEESTQELEGLMSGELITPLPLKIKAGVSAAWSIAWTLAVIGFIGWSMYGFIVGRFGAAQVVVLLLIVVFTALFFQKALFGLDYWLAPGTLICRRQRLWWRNARVRWCRPEQTVLVIQCDKRDEWREFQVFAPGWAGQWSLPKDLDWALLAGWLSTARRPTREEIVSFLGPDVEVDDKMDLDGV